VRPRIHVVADDPEAQHVAGWLVEDLGAEVRAGPGSDETLAEIVAAPPQVVVLAAGLRAGDALSFAVALRAEASLSLVLVADHDGPVRNALDALPFRADRFLRRPLSRSALSFAVRSCLNLGRAGVVDAVDPPRPAVESALSAWGQIDAPARPAAPAEISSGVALYTLDARLDQATCEAIDAFLEDAVEAVLSGPPVALPEEPIAASPSPTEPAPRSEWRESTVVLASAPQAPEELRTGTFVSALRRHMSAVEARLFGTPAAGRPPDDETGEIDLDAIGVTTITSMVDEDPVTDAGIAPPSAPSASGTAPGADELIVDDAASLLGRLSREAVTGRVDFRSGDARKTVWLEEGRPVFAASESPADRMGDLLVREGKIGREQLARAREARDASGRRIGEILVEQGALKRRELYPAVRRHLEDLIYSLFSWEGGTCTVTPGGSARDEKIRLAAPAAALIYEGIRRKLDLERLRALVGPPSTVLAPRRDDLAEALADVELAAEERRLLAGFDGRRSLAEIAAEAGAAETTVYQLAHLARALDLAVAAETDGGRLTTGVVGPAAGTGDAGIDRERVLSKYAQVLEGDYFEILGVRRDATGYEVRRAFETARRDYARESFPAEVQRDLDDELAAIAEVLDEAQRVLRDDRMRAAYRDALQDGA
jgi:CheY-like chemotaxis protein